MSDRHESSECVKRSWENRVIKLSHSLAKKLRESQDGNLHFTFIFEKRRLLSSGVNDLKTHPLASSIGYRYSRTHSELSAIRKLGVDYNFRSCVLINTRVMRGSDTLGMAKPCNICYQWMRSLPYQFGAIYYTDRNGNFERLLYDGTGNT